MNYIKQNKSGKFRATSTNGLKQIICFFRRKKKVLLFYLIKPVVLEMGENMVKEKYVVKKFG